MTTVHSYKNEIYKIAKEKAKMPDRMKTKFWKDRFVPEMKNTAGGVAGGVAGYQLGKLFGRGAPLPKTAKELKAFLTLAGYTLGFTGVQTHRLDKLHKQEFGKGADIDVHMRAADARNFLPFLGTPEAAVKKEMRTKWLKEQRRKNKNKK